MVCIKEKKIVDNYITRDGKIYLAHKDAKHTPCSDAVYATRENYLEICERHKTPMTPVYSGSLKHKKPRIAHFVCFQCIGDKATMIPVTEKITHKRLFGKEDVQAYLDDYRKNRAAQKVENGGSLV